jgi:hypothetical protein
MSPVWEFIVGARTAPVDTSWGTTLDVDGNGYADVVVGAPTYSSFRGGAYVYLGSVAGLSATAAWAQSGAPSSSFGRSVASAGDVNGDGFGDLIVGANGAGAAYVYLGSASGLGAAAWTPPGPAGSNFGWSVASAGDVNGDGYADVIVGDNMGAGGAGVAYVYLGSATGLGTVAAWTQTGPAGSYYGDSVTGACDVNGDGYADVVVGAVRALGYSGAAYAYLGSASGLATVPTWSQSGAANAGFGNSLSCAGDVDGNGFADLIVGASQEGSSVGRAYLYVGGAGGLAVTAAWSQASLVGTSSFGQSVTNAGDVNGDGFGDIAVGSPQHLGGSPAVLVYLGSITGLGTTPMPVLYGAMNSYFGMSVAIAGDVNGDTYADLLVGADYGGVGPGEASVFLGGGTGLATTAAWTVAGPGGGSLFGTTVASASEIVTNIDTSDVRTCGRADVDRRAFGLVLRRSARRPAPL